VTVAGLVVALWSVRLERRERGITLPAGCVPEHS